VVLVVPVADEEVQVAVVVAVEENGAGGVPELLLVKGAVLGRPGGRKT
jgi:hypothetical protein